VANDDPIPGRTTAGRPRDEALTPAILETARRLVIERGHENVTTELIARTTGTSKQAIYRRWPTKQDLILDALLAYAVEQIDRPYGRWPGLRVALVGFVERLFEAVQSTSAVVRALMAEAQRDDAFRQRFIQRLIEPRENALRQLLTDAAEQGELSQTAPVEQAIELIYGAFWYQLLLDRDQSPAHTAVFAEMVVQSLVRR
jgi:AcrR family transcriptional regulator